MNKVKILLVDDRPEGVIALEAILNDPDYNLIKAHSGREALAQVLQHDFAVILLDVQMPDMDGFETAKLIKQRDKSKNIPIVFVTAINEADRYVMDGYAAGAIDYIFKPYEPMVLKSKVAVLVDLYRKNHAILAQQKALSVFEKRENARVLAELELESRRRYQNLADAIPQIIWRANSAGSLEYYNHFWYLYAGLPREMDFTSAWCSVVEPNDLKDVEEKWNEALRARTGFECECRLRRGHDGSYRWHLLRVVPEFDSMSALTGWLGTANDVHDQKLIQEELQRAKEAADVANEAKSRFLANMSHEIRTPLGAMLGFAELLLNKNLAEVQKDDYIAIIRRNGEQLSKIINEILDLSKVEAGRLDVEIAGTSIAELLNDVKSLMSLAASDKGLQLEFKVEGKIPEQVQTDPLRLRQILINIIGNGIKFTEEGKVEVIVSVQDDHEDGQHPKLQILVRDSGPGLNADQIENLFKPFSQADTSISRRYGGTGLGLAFSRKLARALGGDVTVRESEPGEGSVFLITIDIGAINQEELAETLEFTQPMAPANQNETVDLQGAKVLLAEDTEDTQCLITYFLQNAGAKVDLAVNGREAYEKALNGDYDVVLMDIQMPIMDGYLATKKLRSEGFKKPIIALTAHAMKEERKKSLGAGCDDHLTKPVDRLALLKRVQSFSNPSMATASQ